MDEDEATAAKQLEAIAGPLREALRRAKNMPRELAEDHTQETLAQLWKAARRGNVDLSALSNPVGYAYRWALNVDQNWQRRETARGEREQWSQSSDLCLDPAATAAENVDVLRALERLPPRQREVVYLHRSCDLPLDEIADILRIQPGTARTHLWRGEARLRELLGTSERRQP
jgi:RNA polymerase sigma-70 factor (ECF subfamily)